MYLKTPITEHKIKLTDLEQNLFKVLREFVLNASEDDPIRSCELRVAGGWVRDKLLGLNNDDIDITVSNMTGYAFAVKLNEYIKTLNIKSSSVALIKANPDQSKHLETAKVRILDVWVDFCNLRKESYSERSRIPQNEIGTPFEDAHRRDLTINALFYNLITEKVEDYTGKGIKHLKDKVICTPLDPLVTYMEDPLRVIRTIRFACKLEGFRIEDSLIEAAKTSDVLKAFETKLSKERIGMEYESIIKSKRPELGMYYIVEFRLYHSIFSGSPFPIEGTDNTYVNNSRILMNIIRTLDIKDNFNQKIAVLASNMLPFKDYKEKKLSAVEYFLLTSIKFPRKSYEDVNRILEVVDSLSDIIFKIMNLIRSSVEVTHKHIYDISKRSTIGTLLRTTGTLWFEAIIVSSLKYFQPIDEPVHPIMIDPLFDINDNCIKSILLLKEFIEKENLIGVWDMKPLLNGNEVMSLLNIKGPKVRKVMEDQIIFMLENPNADKTQCQEWLIKDN